MRVRSSSGRREIGDIDGEGGGGSDNSMGELSSRDEVDVTWDVLCMFTCQIERTIVNEPLESSVSSTLVDDFP